MRLDDVCQMYPSRLTILPQRTKATTQKLVESYLTKMQRDQRKQQYEENFARSKETFELSKSSKRKIFDSINSMYALSQPRTIKMQNGKSLYNFRLAFITLTLPSKQRHSDTTLKHELLNQFLFEIKRKYKISNFVWKAELQKNENIHFHLIIDKYIDFQALRRRWNRILNKLDYVTQYQKKMRGTTITEYHKNRCKYKPCTYNESVESYASGVRSNWCNPNSVDVKSVFGKKDLAIYLGKYFAKPISADKLSKKEKKRLIKFGRIWSRSYTLVNLKYQNKYIVSEIQAIIKYLDSQRQKVKKVVGDYFTVYYFNVADLNTRFKKFHKAYMLALANIYNYPIPI